MVDTTNTMTNIDTAVFGDLRIYKQNGNKKKNMMEKCIIHYYHFYDSQDDGVIYILHLLCINNK